VTVFVLEHCSDTAKVHYILALQICPHVGNLCNDSGFSPHQVHGLFSYCKCWVF